MLCAQPAAGMRVLGFATLMLAGATSPCLMLRRNHGKDGAEADAGVASVTRHLLAGGALLLLLYE